MIIITTEASTRLDGALWTYSYFFRYRQADFVNGDVQVLRWDGGTSLTVPVRRCLLGQIDRGGLVAYPDYELGSTSLYQTEAVLSQEFPYIVLATLGNNYSGRDVTRTRVDVGDPVGALFPCTHELTAYQGMHSGIPGIAKPFLATYVGGVNGACSDISVGPFESLMVTMLKGTCVASAKGRQSYELEPGTGISVHWNDTDPREPIALRIPKDSIVLAIGTVSL